MGSRTLPHPFRGNVVHALVHLIAVTFAFTTAPARADVPTRYEEQYKLMRAPNAVASVGTDLFGDTVNLYNGGLQFRHTDVSLPGNNALPVSIGRRITAGEYRLDGRAFGEWELDIPHIYLNVPHSVGWVNSSGTAARCSSFSQPAHAIGSSGSDWDPNEFWQGTFLYVPGAGAQQMLSRSAEDTASPGLAKDYPVVTSRFWNFSCLASVKGDAAAGSAGEGFVAISPDGIKYYFDWVARYTARSMFKSDPASMSAMAMKAPPTTSGTRASPSSLAAATTYTLFRDEMWVLPSKAVDRFGNTVTFTYDPAKPRNLTRIDSSDGRSITLTYVTDVNGNDQIGSVFDGTRTWRYSYHSTPGNPRSVTNLDVVTLPDNSTWNFASFDTLLTPITLVNNGGCDSPPLINTNTISGAITHPTGAVGSFTLTPTIHGRSHIQRICNIYTLSEALVVPRYFATQSLTSKSMSGPGLSTLNWTYDYGPTNESWDTCTTCVTTKTVSVTNPASEVSRYTFGNEHNVSEGRLQLTETGWNGSSAMSSVSQRYRAFGA
ncbi:MAG: hypothetical protein H7232_04195, partial [Aeromicrobium sp.]|nr:hypothetical protein [Burkholderiales bacterium]